MCPLEPSTYKRVRGRLSDGRPDGQAAGIYKHYGTGLPLEIGDPLWIAEWKSEDNTYPKDFGDVGAIDGGGLGDIIAWALAHPDLQYRQKLLEILLTDDPVTHRPTRRIYGDLWVEGDAHISGIIYGPSDILGTTSNIFTIDTDAADDTINKILRMYRGPSLTPADFWWDYTLQRFKTNFPLDVPQLLINGVPIDPSPAGERVEYARFEAWECYNENEIDPHTKFLDAERGLIYDITVEGPSASCSLAVQFRVGPDFDSLLGTNDFEVYALASAPNTIRCSITLRNQSSGIMGTLPSGYLDGSGWSTAKKSVSCTANPPSAGQIVTAVFEFSNGGGVLPEGSWFRITIPTYRYNRFAS